MSLQFQFANYLSGTVVG